MRYIKKLIDPIANRVTNMILRGVVQLIDDAKKMQELQVTGLYGEVIEGVERIQQYGFTSVPLAGSECVVLFVGGYRDHPIALSVEDRATRKKGLQSGDAAAYTHRGNYILLKAIDGTIELYVPPGGGKIRLEADEIDIHARIELNYDAGGTGYKLRPGFIDSYTQGAISNSHPINPPEIP